MLYWGYFCLLIFYCLFSLIYVIFTKTLKTLNIHYIKNKSPQTVLMFD